MVPPGGMIGLQRHRDHHRGVGQQGIEHGALFAGRQE